MCAVSVEEESWMSKLIFIFLLICSIGTTIGMYVTGNLGFLFLFIIFSIIGLGAYVYNLYKKNMEQEKIIIFLGLLIVSLFVFSAIK